MNNEENKYDLIKFGDEDFSLDVNVSPDEDNVWLSTNEIALLFERDEKTIRKHINNVFLEKEVDKNNNTHFLRVVGVKQKVAFYSLNVIISVGYRIKSSRRTKFKDWALNEIEKFKNQNNQKMALSQYIFFNYDEIKLNVNVDPDKDTVWLNKNQLVILFDTTRQNLEYHINNIYSQNELVEEATCKKILQVQMNGNREIGR